MHSHSRRGFLGRTLGAAWWGATILERAALVATRARAQSKAPLPILFDVEKVADGVYAAVANGRALINCNAAIFENANDLLIVDAHSAPSAVYSLVAQIRKQITDKPVRYVVATHLHGDHTQGLPAYRSIAPKADIIASAKTRSLMVELGPARLKAAVDAVPRSIDNLSRKLSSAKNAEERAYYREMIDQSRAFLEEMRNVPVELPDVTFDDQLTIHDKAHDLHLSFRGRAHTAGDIVVACPAKKVVASGDVLHSFFPTIGDGYPSEWPATLRSVQQLEFEKVIGGHGGVLDSPQRAGQLRDYLDELLEIVARAKHDGVPLDRLQQTVNPGSVKTLQGGYGDYLADEVKKHDFRVYLSTHAQVLAAGVRDNLAAVYRNYQRA
ncbi:MAG TPA: MBL fold metallo-hydrolase [Candidatus Limnocylindrales bacterium]|nr:MBL fold metallo-hydrolase [Candidatus Limnocylindrales bacterium]